MLRRSLTIKILIAVGVTVAAVIAIYTYFVIRVQSAWWYERTQSQNVLTTAMVGEHLQSVMLGGRGQEVQDFLVQLKKSEEIRRGRIIKNDGEIIFSTETQEVRSAYYRTPPELFTGDRVLHGTRREGGERIAVAMSPIKSQPACVQCHDSGQRVLGAIVLEKSMATATASIAGNRSLLVAYGLVIFVLVGIVLWLLIVRFVTQPVRDILRRMHRVQQGDLSARAPVEGEDEVGRLARGFNAMVESLETSRRQLSESHDNQIQQASKLASIGELASGIAHEIRNPLAGIGAAVEILAENNGNHGPYAEVACEIRGQIARLNRTLRDLLDFARPREPEAAPCDVTDLIKPMLALVRPDAQKNRIQIVENFAPNLPPILADAQQLQQAILNVLLNAAQAMAAGGTLTVQTDMVDCPPSVRIRISDTGVGIPRENMARIFSPFYTTKHRGTGLGLSITRTIVDKHRGRIDVESEPGRGTAFALWFAACQATNPAVCPAEDGLSMPSPECVGKEM